MCSKKLRGVSKVMGAQEAPYITVHAATAAAPLLYADLAAATSCSSDPPALLLMRPGHPCRRLQDLQDLLNIPAGLPNLICTWHFNFLPICEKVSRLSGHRISSLTHLALGPLWQSLSTKVRAQVDIVHNSLSESDHEQTTPEHRLREPAELYCCHRKAALQFTH